MRVSKCAPVLGLLSLSGCGRLRCLAPLQLRLKLLSHLHSMITRNLTEGCQTAVQQLAAGHGQQLAANPRNSNLMRMLNMEDQPSWIALHKQSNTGSAP